MKIRALVLILSSFMLVAIADDVAPDQHEWEQIQNTKEVSTLQTFIAKYPTSKFADQASRRIDQLAWEKVDKKDMDAVKEFIRTHPDMGIDLKSLTPEEERTRSPGAAAPTEENPRQQILAALEQLGKAATERNVGYLRTVWPRANQSFVKRFQAGKNGKVQFQPVSDPYVEGDKATISCWYTATTGSGDKETTSQEKVLIKFRHEDKSWVVDEIP